MTRARWVLGAAVAAGLLAVPGWRAVESTRMTHRAVATHVAILAAAEARDLDALRPLFTERYLRAHPLELAPGGGLAGLPRGIHKNFWAWREGDEAWLCPRDRVGPVYRFRFEGGACRFDGPAGLLGPGGVVTPVDEGDAGLF